MQLSTPLQVSVLLLGKGLDTVAKHAAGVSGVTKVLVVENEALVNSLAEDVSAVVTQVAKKYTHILAPSTNNGKNYLPRAAALLDSSPLSDILAVVDESTFKRPMYAGNAIATMKMTNDHKVRWCCPAFFSGLCAVRYLCHPSSPTLSMGCNNVPSVTLVLTVIHPLLHLPPCTAVPAGAPHRL